MPKKTKAIKVTDKRQSKPWLRKSEISKYRRTIKKKKRFLIVCEGYSEANYFKSFPVVSAQVESLPLGCDPLNIVKCTLDIIKSENYDEVWCVFDVDIKPSDKTQKEKFNKAIELAERSKINLAYSNDCFELWVYLHFQYTDQRNHRDFYFEELGKLFNVNYRKEGKSQSFTRLLYARLKERNDSSQEEALKRAEKLTELGENILPFDRNPSTLINKLVTELNNHLKE